MIRMPAMGHNHLKTVVLVVIVVPVWPKFNIHITNYTSAKYRFRVGHFARNSGLFSGLTAMGVLGTLPHHHYELRG